MSLLGGDKVKMVCINNLRFEEIEVGKCYDTIPVTVLQSTSSIYAYIIDGFKDAHLGGGDTWFPACLFITVDEWRESRLNEIGI